MEDTEDYASRLAATRAAGRQQDWAAAQAGLRVLLQAPEPGVEVRLLQARLSQLSDAPDPTLLDLPAIAPALRAAAAACPDHAGIPLELGHLQHAVLDQPTEAMAAFDTAAELAMAQLTEALRGYAEAAASSHQSAAAQPVLQHWRQRLAAWDFEA